MDTSDNTPKNIELNIVLIIIPEKLSYTIYILLRITKTHV